MKTADEIRSAFLKYFEDRGHRVVRSSSLVPESDPTLLFANAGMNQFKDVFLGKEKRDYTRATSSQKCVRAGGKHNDLENVGQTARHHTFFEMLGNFSFGDYFKQDAIAFAWELLTKDLALPKDRLTVTIFRGEAGIPRDAEAHGFWKAHVADDRILELGMMDNFWAMGDTGPCGPCSEIHFFQGDSLPCAEVTAGRACLGVECECDRWLEIWNLVFMQYNRDAAGTLNPLPAPCVDTGMGLERIAAVVQGKLSNYESDLFTPLLAAVAIRAGKTYRADATDDMSMRVVADHLRATTFLVSDGVHPGNEGRGYVLRKIMRRAIRHGKRLAIEGSFMSDLTAPVVERMRVAYPELLVQANVVAKVVRAEEERFATTWATFEKLIPLHFHGQFSSMQAVAETAERTFTTLPGDIAFKLFDTYGMPRDLIEELATEYGRKVEWPEFERLLDQQRERARRAAKMDPITAVLADKRQTDSAAAQLGQLSGQPTYDEIYDLPPTQFVGYDQLSLDDAKVVSVRKAGKTVSQLGPGESGELILDRTPFYPTGGGQVGDQGAISTGGALAEVTDTIRLPVGELTAHFVRVTAGAFVRGMTARAEVNAQRRAGAMRNHTGTHLLHAALREILGPHVKQAGSLVAPDHLRFDFSHYAGVTPPELRHIENRVNGQILRDSALQQKVMGREEALAYGALAFFGDKYGERVRVVEIPGFSKEFCGGTHVPRTGEIGLFLFTAEQGVAAGTRRVEALTGEAAMERAQRDQGILEELEGAAKVDRRALVDEYAKLREQLKAKEREIQGLKMKLATGTSGATAAQDLVEVGGVQLWTPRFEGLDRKAHAAVVDDFRNRNKDRAFVLVSASIDGEGVNVISAVSDSLKDRVKAPEVMKRLGLRGGGRPDFAQGGGVAPADVDGLRKKAGEVMRAMLEGTGAA